MNNNEDTFLVRKMWKVFKKFNVDKQTTKKPLRKKRVKIRESVFI